MKKPTKKVPREPVTGGPDTVPMDADRKKFLEEMRRRNEQAQKEANKEAKKSPDRPRGMKAGGKVKKMAKGGSSCGGKVKKMAKGGMVSKRADGKAMRGKTKCRMM